jgi:hypothetical protein
MSGLPKLLAFFESSMGTAIDNAIGYWKTVFHNLATNAFLIFGAIVDYAKWLGRQLEIAIDNAAGFWTNTFTNLFGNIGSIFANLKDLITGEIDWDDVWKPLTDGFKKQAFEELPKQFPKLKSLSEGFFRDTFEEFPDITTRAMTDVERSLAKGIVDQSNELSQRMKDGLKGAIDDAAVAGQEQAGALGAQGGAAGAGTQAASQAQGGAFTALREANRRIQQALGGKDPNTEANEETAKNTKRQLEESKQQTKAMWRIAGSFNGGPTITVMGTR